jgi:hypothetical protein
MGDIKTLTFPRKAGLKIGLDEICEHVARELIDYKLLRKSRVEPRVAPQDLLFQTMQTKPNLIAQFLPPFQPPPS